ncbi:hypothetical protein Peur_008743 [Populus x canadensis]
MDRTIERIREARMKSRGDDEKKKRKRDFSECSQMRHSQRQWLERERAEGARREECYCGWRGDMEKINQWRCDTWREMYGFDPRGHYPQFKKEEKRSLNKRRGELSSG